MTVPTNIGSSQCLHIGAMCWSWKMSILQFTQSIRTANFNQFTQTLTKLLPCCCCFDLDHINYARWLSVYLRDICQLGGNGWLVVQKTWRLFSAIAHDQAHQQWNAMVKGNGGSIGLNCQPAPQKKATRINGQTSEEAANPFEDDGGCLIALDSKVIVDAAAMTAASSCSHHHWDMQQYNNFVEERLE